MLVAFYLNILPEDLRGVIPRSTLYDWGTKSVEELVGYHWYCQEQPLFSTLKEVALNKRLLKLNIALLRIIAIQRFLKKYKVRIREKVLNAAETVIHNISKVRDELGLVVTLKSIALSHQQYRSLQRKARCSRSALRLCLVKHPSQLLKKEIIAIRDYCTDTQLSHWPLTAVYHKMIRDRVVQFHQSTFYKYVRQLELKRKKAVHRRKNHATGIRAAAPLQLLHADVTVFKPQDQSKAYIYLVQDNFCRAILSYSVAMECKASIMVELIRKVHDQYLKPASISYCQLMTDDGSENHGAVGGFLATTQQPALRQIIAQKDISFSNSMIEAAHKNLKYRFLYHKVIPDFKTLCLYLPEAIDDYNNRPHAVLEGLTPLEVLAGKTVDAEMVTRDRQMARTARIKTNQQQKCCGSSF